jgi:hypothetical protein
MRFDCASESSGLTYGLSMWMNRDLGTPCVMLVVSRTGVCLQARLQAVCAACGRTHNMLSACMFSTCRRTYGQNCKSTIPETGSCMLVSCMLGSCMLLFYLTVLCPMQASDAQRETQSTVVPRNFPLCAGTPSAAYPRRWYTTSTSTTRTTCT